MVEQVHQRPGGDVIIPMQRIGVAETTRTDSGVGLRDQLFSAAQRPVRPVAEGVEECCRAKVKLPFRDYPVSELSLGTTAALEAANPLGHQPAPPQVVLARDTRQVEHRLHAGDVDEHAAEVEQDRSTGSAMPATYRAVPRPILTGGKA